MKLIADKNTNVTNQLEFLESLVTWPASLKKNIPANKNGCRALSIDFVGRAALEIQILYTCPKPHTKSSILIENQINEDKSQALCLHYFSAWACLEKM